MLRVCTVAGMVATFAIAAFSQGNVSERVKVAGGKHFASVKLSQGNNGQLTVCAESTGAMTGQFQLKVWQLKSGQTSETAMASNRIVATASFHAINTKGTGANNNRTTTTAESSLIADCDQFVGETPATEGQRTRTKSNSTNERFAGVLDGVPSCAAGSTCDYVGVIEPIVEKGRNATATTSSQNVFRFTISPDGIRVQM